MKGSTEEAADMLTHLLKKLGDSTPTEGQTEPVAARVLERLRKDHGGAGWRPVIDPQPRLATRKRQVVLALTGAAVILASLLYVFLIQPMSASVDAHAIAEFADGLYRDNGDSSRLIVTGERIDSGQPIRVDGTGAVLSLSDGSRIEMRSQAKVTLEPDRDGVRVRLRAGSIIVTAAKQRRGHLYVATKDCTVSVVGTVFLVVATEIGSRVAVIQGEVRVSQDGRENTLRPGQQVSTSLALPPFSVAEEIAWSRNIVAHMAMLELAGASAQALQTPPPELGTIQGTVLQAGTGTPISEVQSSLARGPQSTASRFDTISIRPFDRQRGGIFNSGDLVLPGGLYRDPFAQLLTLITESYDVKDSSHTLIGLPAWAKSTAWTIVARAGPEYAAASADENAANVKAMIRSMLEERFKLKIHQEERPTKVLVLLVKEGGAKLQSASAPVPPEKEGSIRMNVGDRRGSLSGKKVTIGQLATVLTIFLPQVVVDRTGLTGFYDFDEKWEAAYRQGDPVPPTSLGPDGLAQLVSYLDQKLGLVLKSETAPVQHWIVDHVEMPSEN